MFEGLDIRKEEEPKGIFLTTRGRKMIPNMIAPRPSQRDVDVYKEVRKEYGQGWNPRKDACGVYNCYGMILASRRTAIYNDKEIREILLSDGYDRTDQQRAFTGDLVLYFEERGAEGDNFLHLGVITKREAVVAGGDPVVIWVLSKWDDRTGEDEHRLETSLFHRQGYNVKVEFWTDRFTL